MATIFIQHIFLITILTLTSATLTFSKQTQTIYEILKSNGLPMGLLPKGVTNFTFDDSGRFEVHLDQACNSKFENEFHYDQKISVKAIRVDIPSSGLIYFDVGVVHKQFSLSSFDTPRDCLVSAIDYHNQLITQSVPTRLSRKLGHRKRSSHQERLVAIL
ncbi:uncharacterized protein [Rutidosis leptorrhynchoides]|uniref:uncharacterized protein isoform X2 n=1 Tax=Rutidosis leptorrhynchoides TaxID=125765 RepID=UPI003A998BDB